MFMNGGSTRSCGGGRRLALEKSASHGDELLQCRVGRLAVGFHRVHRTESQDGGILGGLSGAAVDPAQEGHEPAHLDCKGGPDCRQGILQIEPG